MLIFCTPFRRKSQISKPQRDVLKKVLREA